MSDPLFRTPPHNIEAEQALLGACLVNNSAVFRVSDFLLPEHFLEHAHGLIYEAIVKVVEAGKLASPVTLKAVFEHMAALEDIGGTTYLARLAGSAVTVIDAEHYGRVIYDLAIRREIIDVGQRAVNDAYDVRVEDTANDQIERIENDLYRLATKGTTNQLHHIGQSIGQAITNAQERFKSGSNLVGLSTGFKSLDDQTGGLAPTDLIIVGARPSMGKSALVTNMAVTAARSGVGVLLFSIEMGHEQVGQRVLAAATGVSADDLRRGKVQLEDFERFLAAQREFEDIPLWIDPTSAISIGEVVARSRRMARRHDIGLVVVDYIQLMRGSPERNRDGNRVLEIADITGGLKELAKTLEIPVVAASQLNRGVEGREEKRPHLGDLRDSGAIEQDADGVWFVHRPEVYIRRRERRYWEKQEEKVRWEREMDEWEGVAEIIVAKNRNGPTGMPRLMWNQELVSFFDIVERDHLPEQF